MAPAACSAAPAGHRVFAPVPVAWLEGDVLAEYLLFVEETATPPPAPSTTRVPVAWLEGKARDEFLRFLDESRAKEAAAEVGLEQQQDGHGSEKAAGGGDAEGYDDGGGLMVDDGGESGLFMEDGAGAMEEDESGDGGVFVEKQEQEAEPVLELLLPHILDLPAFRALVAMFPFPSPEPERSRNEEQHLGRIFTLNCSRNVHVPDPERRNVERGTWPRSMFPASKFRAPPAVAVLQQEPVLGFPCYHGGWMSGVSSLIEVDSCTSSSSSHEEMSSVEEEFEEDACVRSAAG